MLPLLAVSAGLGLAKAGYGIYQGIKQNNQAKKIDTTRPTYNIPGEVAANQAMYRDMANSSRMPGQSIAENNIKAGTANSLNALTQTGGGVNNILAAVGGLNQNQNNAMNNLATQGAQFQLQNKDKFANSNNVMAQYRDKAFDYNKNQPYMMNVARKNALQQAGATNINNGLTTAGNTATALAGLGSGLKTGAAATGAEYGTTTGAGYGYPQNNDYGSYSYS